MTNFFKYDRIDDLITFKLSGDKCPVFRQFLVNFTFLPSSNSLIHSSSGMFIAPQARSVSVASIRCSVREIADQEKKSAFRKVAKVQIELEKLKSAVPVHAAVFGSPANCSQSAP